MKKSPDPLDWYRRQPRAVRAVVAARVGELDTEADWLQGLRLHWGGPHDISLKSDRRATLFAQAVLLDPSRHVQTVAWSSTLPAPMPPPDWTAHGQVVRAFVTKQGWHQGLLSKVAGVPEFWAIAWARDAGWLLDLLASPYKLALGRSPMESVAALLVGVRSAHPAVKHESGWRDIVSWSRRFVEEWPHTHGWASLQCADNATPNLTLYAAVCLLTLHGVPADLNLEYLYDEVRASPFERAMYLRLRGARDGDVPLSRTAIERFLFDRERVRVAPEDSLGSLISDPKISSLARLDALGRSRPAALDRYELARVVLDAEDEVEHMAHQPVDPWSRLFALRAALRPLASAYATHSTGRLVFGSLRPLPKEIHTPDHWKALTRRVRELLLDALRPGDASARRFAVQRLLETECVIDPIDRGGIALAVARCTLGESQTDDRVAHSTIEPLLLYQDANEWGPELQALEETIAAARGLLAVRTFFGVLRERFDGRARATLDRMDCKLSTDCGAVLRAVQGKGARFHVKVQRRGAPGEHITGLAGVQIEVLLDGRKARATSTDTDGIATVEVPTEALTSEVELRIVQRATVAGIKVRVECFEFGVDALAERFEPEFTGLVAAALATGSNVNGISKVNGVEPLGDGLSGSRVFRLTCRAPYAPLVLKTGPAAAIEREFNGYRGVIAPTIPGLSYGVLPPIMDNTRGVLVYNLVDGATSLADLLAMRNVSTDVKGLLERLMERWWSGCEAECNTWATLHPEDMLPRWQAETCDLDFAHPDALTSDSSALRDWVAGAREWVTLTVSSLSSKSAHLRPVTSDPHLRVSLGSDWQELLCRLPELRVGERIGVRRRSGAVVLDLHTKILRDLANTYTELTQNFWSFPVGPIHGDLHPRNVMIEGSRVSLIDFARTRLRGCPYFDLARLELYLRLWSTFDPDAHVEGLEDAVDTNAVGAHATVAAIHEVRRVATRLAERDLNRPAASAPYDLVLAIAGMNMERFEDSRYGVGRAWRAEAMHRALKRLKPEGAS